MTDHRAARLLAWTLLTTALVGCGLKGPLTLPEKSTNVVIRGPGGTPAEAGTTPSGESTAAPETPAAPAPTTTPKPAAPGPKAAPPADDRMPPPPLPGGTPGGPGG